jgi:hypothetical protein
VLFAWRGRLSCRSRRASQFERAVAQSFSYGVTTLKQVEVRSAIEMQRQPIAALDFGTGL